MWVESEMNIFGYIYKETNLLGQFGEIQLVKEKWFQMNY